MLKVEPFPFINHNFAKQEIHKFGPYTVEIKMCLTLCFEFYRHEASSITHGYCPINALLMFLRYYSNSCPLSFVCNFALRYPVYLPSQHTLTKTNKGINFKNVKQTDFVTSCPSLEKKFETLSTKYKKVKQRCVFK